MKIVQYTGAAPLSYDSVAGKSWSIGEVQTVSDAEGAALIATGNFSDASAAMATPSARPIVSVSSAPSGQAVLDAASLQVLAASGVGVPTTGRQGVLVVSNGGLVSLDLGAKSDGIEVVVANDSTSKWINVDPTLQYDFKVTLRNDTTQGHLWAWPTGTRWESGSAPALPVGPHAFAVYRFRSAAGSYVFVGTPVLGSTSTIASDSFPDTNGVALTSRPTAIGSKTWAAVASSTFVTDGTGGVTSTSNIDGDRVVADVGVSDFTLKVTATAYFTSGSDPTTRNTCGIVFRYVDTTNFWYVELDPYNNSAFLYRVLAGTYVKMAAYLVPKTSGVPHVIQVETIGPNITVTIDNQEGMTYCDATHQTATKIGFRSGKNSNSPATLPRYAALTVLEATGLPIKHPIFAKPFTNPVIPKGTGTQWNATDLNNPNVILDPVSGKYLTDGSGYYNDGGDTGIQHQGFWSADSLDQTTWTPLASNATYTADGLDGRYAFNGGLVYMPSLGLYVYASVSAAGSSIRLWTMTTIGGQRTDRGLIVVPTAATPYTVGAFDPSLRIRQDGQIEMWFCAAAGRRTICKGIIDTNTWKFTLGTGIQPVLIPPTNLFAQAFLGEPWCYVPPGQEDKQAMVFFDGSDPTATVPPSRRIGTATTLDGGKSWKYRVNAVAPQNPGTGVWEANQNFDCCVYDAGDGFLRSYFSGANASGAALNLNIQIGLAKAPWVAGQGLI